MKPRSPRQRADAILVTLRTAPLAAMYFWRAVPLHHNNDVCASLGDLAVRQIMTLDNEESARSTPELNSLMRSMWPENTDVAIEQALRRELAVIERRATFRLIRGGVDKIP